MSQLYADRCKEFTTTTGTGTVTTGGLAPPYYQTILAGIGNGNSTDYLLLSGDGESWETGHGVVATSGGSGACTLTRATIYASSNSGSAISLSGTSTVIVTVPAQRLNALGGDAPAMPVGIPTQTNTGLSTWLNQGTASAANQPVGLNIANVGQSGDTWRLLYKAAPSTPYSFTALIGLNVLWTTSISPAVAVGWTDGTKLELIALQFNGGATPKALNIFCQKWNTTTSWNSNAAGIASAISAPLWVKLLNDGTNVHFGVGTDGYNFTDLYADTVSGGWLSAYTDVFFGFDPNTAGGSGTLMSWAQGTS